MPTDWRILPHIGKSQSMPIGAAVWFYPSFPAFPEFGTASAKLLATRAAGQTSRLSRFRRLSMFTFDKSDFQRFMVAAVGALTLTAASVVAAAGPAKAAGQITNPTTFAAR
jgi:hypothetical protein